MVSIEADCWRVEVFEASGQLICDSSPLTYWRVVGGEGVFLGNTWALPCGSRVLGIGSVVWTVGSLVMKKGFAGWMGFAGCMEYQV